MHSNIAQQVFYIFDLGANCAGLGECGSAGAGAKVDNLFSI